MDPISEKATANTGQKTTAAVENVVQIAEERHYNTMVNMAETANHEHQLQMASVTREASDAFQRQAQDHAQEKQALQREAVIHAETWLATLPRSRLLRQLPTTQGSNSLKWPFNSGRTKRCNF